MTKTILTEVFNALIEKGYSFSTMKALGSSEHYELVNERTSCKIVETKRGTYISLCLHEDKINGSYASERRVAIETWEDMSAARELIKKFEDLCDEDACPTKYYKVTVIHHSYYDEVNGLEGYKEELALFKKLNQAEEFVKSAPGYNANSDCELYYEIHPVNIQVEE